MNHQTQQPNTIRTLPEGSVLIVVIWIVLILASLILVLAHTIRVEAVAATNHVSQVQAEAVANGAIQYVFAKLSEESSSVSYSTNPDEAMQVGDGYFWILRPNLSDDRNYDFGRVDEAGKINLNSDAPQELLEMLLKLPNMTAELANSIIDWQDEDEDVSAGGAEGEYYLLLGEPYQCKNAPLETIEEVLLIKGGSLQLLYGEDTNRNGMLDWNENDGEQSPPADNSNNRLDPGFFNYVTIHSYETATDEEGQQRLDLNDPQNQAAVQTLIGGVAGSENAIAIMQSLRNGGLFRGGTTGSNMSLIDAYLISGMKYEDFNQIMDRLTMDGRKQTIAGRINVNTAPQEVLLCLPGLEESDVDALIQNREKSGADLSSILWVAEVLDANKARGIGRYITVKSSQYSADIVAVSSDGRAFARYFVVVDVAQGTPKIIYKQSLHYAGWPLDPKILETLRAGQELQF
jgi:type II secretory pathway component PulK